MLSDLANLTHAQKDYEMAWDYYRQALQICADLGHRGSVARVMVLMAKCAASQSKAKRALKLAGAASALLQHAGRAGNPDHDEIREIAVQAKSQIGDLEHAQAWADGQAMTVDQVCEYVRGAED